MRKSKGGGEYVDDYEVAINKATYVGTRVVLLSNCLEVMECTLMDILQYDWLMDCSKVVSTFN